MVTLPEIYALISEVSGAKISGLRPDTDLVEDIGIEGDDFFELMEKFEKRFNADISAYRWYFHHGEEGFLSVGALLFKPPYRRVKRIPVTPEILLACANTHSWIVQYPQRELPKYRFDMLFDQILTGLIAAACLALLVRGWFYT